MSSVWTKSDASKINLNLINTLPHFDINFPVISDELFAWDFMPLKDLKTNDIVKVDKWYVVFSLGCKKEPHIYLNEDNSYDIQSDWENRHMRASIHFWYTEGQKDSVWHYGNEVITQPNKASWSGTPFLKGNKVQFYFTSVDNETPFITYTSLDISANNTEVIINNRSEIKTILEPDGKYYQTFVQNPYLNFRDPSPFINPEDGELYMVFEGNMAGYVGTFNIEKEDIGLVPKYFKNEPSYCSQVGCIGIAKAKDKEGNEWEMLPPLLTAKGITEQTERPHVVFKNNKVYLFTIAHKHLFNNTLTGAEGLFGFYADSLFDTYKPLNESGLVITNPPSSTYQAYSFYVLNNGLVLSFIDSVQTINSDTFRIGGTVSPTIQLTINDTTTSIDDILNYGQLLP